MIASNSVSTVTTDTVDWTKFLDDPNNSGAKHAVKESLPAMRRIHMDADLLECVVAAVARKRVLDVGVVSHAPWKQRLKRIAWRAGRLFAPPDFTFPDYLYEFQVPQPRGRVPE